MLKCGIAPAYVMDEMPMYEADLLLENAYMVDQSAAERMRMMCWMTAQVNSTKKLEPEDLISFSWEKKEREKEPPRLLSDEEVKGMQAYAQKIKEQIYGKRTKIH